MARIRYLTKDSAGLKLRRKVPESLRAIVGKIQFVERVAGKKHTEIRRKANLFAAMTDLALSTARLVSEERGPAPDINVPRDKFDLSREDALTLAREYFTRADSENHLDGTYTAASPDDDHLLDAGAQLAYAQRQLEGLADHQDEDPSTLGYAECVRVLVQAGRLARSDMIESSVARGVEFQKIRFKRELLNNSGFSLLLSLIKRANRELASKRLESLTSGRVMPTRDALFCGPLAFGANGHPSNARDITVGELCTEFREAKRNLSVSRQSDFRLPERILIEELGPKKGLQKITREDARSIAGLLPSIPRYVTQHYKGMSVREAIVAANERNGPNLGRFDGAIKTLQSVKSIFDWAVDQHYIDDNPFSSIKLPNAPRRKFSQVADSGYQPFTINELNIMFAAPLYTGCADDERNFARPGKSVIRRHRFWAPLIALWTGMRMNEILQLECVDVRQTDDIWHISVTDEEVEAGFGKSLKTRQALRVIPVHDQLIKLGFVSWALSQPGPRLFPDAIKHTADKPSGPFSKRFSNFISTLGIGEPRRKVFHSFRNNFNDALREAGVSLEFRELINGWKSQSSMDRKYGRGYTLKALNEQIQTASYPGLHIQHLYVGHE